MLNKLLSSPYILTLLFVSLILLVFSPALYDLILFWWSSEEYNYGLLIPSLVAYILYQKRHEVFDGIHHGSSLGLVLLIISLLSYFLALVADIETIKRYSFILSLASIATILGGILLLKRVAFMLLLLLFSLPLPYLLGSILTSKMQLLSSDIGVWMIRMMGLAVYQDGNVINMSGFQMLVAEACSGLRYLYPLMAIALIITYFYRATWLVKIVIFLMAIPITIGMNSLRIAVTGLLIKNYGQGAAEGFLHDFEGWVVFAVAFALLISSIYALSTVQNVVSKTKKPFTHRFQFEWSNINEKTSYTLNTQTFFIFTTIACSSLIVTMLMTFQHEETAPPAREKFATFPFYLHGREIYPEILSQSIKDVLKADDYFLADYKKRNAEDINLYIVYYENQRDGSALHSPKACLPGGGWKITNSSVIKLDTLGHSGYANRVIIEQSEQKLLVYYWIHQNGQNFANEFKARFSLMKQAITTGRTDGALIRIIRPIVGNKQHSPEHLDFDPASLNSSSLSEEQALLAADTELKEFIRSMVPILPAYLPK